MPVGHAPILDILLLREVLHGTDGTDHQPLCRQDHHDASQVVRHDHQTEEVPHQRHHPRRYRSVIIDS